MRPIVVAAAVAAALGLGACSTNPLSPSSSRPEGTSAAPSFSQFSDVPIPAKASMDVDRSLLLGNGDGWVGRLVYTTWGSASGLYDLYRSDMPSFGWQEITSVRASISVQTWQRGDRIATVQIRDTTLGAEVILTVAPAIGAAPGGSGAMAPPPAAAAPPTSVTRQPLR
jgi:hypothetical protein